MKLITLTDPASTQSEAYRTLRTNLSFYSLDNPLKTLVVAAATPEGNGSEAAANLAVTMAQGGKRTALIEADLRRPAVHTAFDLAAEPGLTNMLLGEDNLPIQETNIPDLAVISPGPLPPNPADLLGSKRLDGILEDLHQKFDIIIFNAPPILTSSDATVLGAKVDGVVLAITSGNTRRDYAQKACEILQKANVRIIGATLLNAPTDRSIGQY